MRLPHWLRRRMRRFDRRWVGDEAERARYDAAVALRLVPPAANPAPKGGGGRSEEGPETTSLVVRKDER